MQLFRRRVWGYYRSHGRDLPWRRTQDPYHILVSEIMLQQTRVERVEGRYERFLERFPDIQALARARLAEVLAGWQGLGYNRRAQALRDTARIVVEQYGGRLPQDESVLVTLPGIGKATAASIAAFAFNRPVLVIETNIRRVFLHCFFAGRDRVPDRELLPLIAAACDRDNPREWYYALMDLGSRFRSKFPNPNRRSAHYQRQAAFEGSSRQARGRLVRLLLDHPGGLALADLAARAGLGEEQCRTLVGALADEGILQIEGSRAVIP